MEVENKRWTGVRELAKLDDQKEIELRKKMEKLKLPEINKKFISFVVSSTMEECEIMSNSFSTELEQRL